MGGVTREEELYLKYQDEVVSGRDVTGKKEECLDVQELCDVVKDVFPEAYRTLYCLYPLINPINTREFLLKLSSGSLILLTITWKLRLVLQNI